MLSSFFPGSCPCRFCLKVLFLRCDHSIQQRASQRVTLIVHVFIIFLFLSVWPPALMPFLLSPFKRWFKDVQKLRQSRFADASKKIQRWLNVASPLKVQKKESLFRLSLTAYLPYPLPTQERSFYRKVSWAWKPWNVLWTLCGQSPVFAKFLQSYSLTALGLGLKKSSNT